MSLSTLKSALHGALIIVAAAALLPTSAQADEAGCTALNGKQIAAAAFTGISVPGGGQVSVAQYVPSKDGAAAFCKVTGQISPLDPQAHPVLFSVNLPENWNGKVVQFGGTGLNGRLVTGLTPSPDQPPVLATPLERGFVTAGTDGGHPGGEVLNNFLLVPEEVVNHAHLAYKKTHDVALELVQTYYKRKPTHFYYEGRSEGGREALAVAQRYPADYDGVIAGVPGIYYLGLVLSSYHQEMLLAEGGWLSPAKVELLQKTANAACDSLDGLEDGVISRYGTCAARIKQNDLRCPQGVDAGDSCLSDKQLALVKALHEPFPFPKPLADGVMSYPRFGWGGEAQPDGLVPRRFPAKKPAAGELGAGGVGNQAVAVMRYAIMGDPKYSGPIPWNEKIKRIQELSALIDATNPDLRAFAARGGKLIIKENGADYAKSPRSGVVYRDAVVGKMGQSAVNGFMRLFVNPGVNHSGNGQQADGSAVPDKVDLLGALDAWVEGGPAPEVLTVTSYTRAAPFTAAASRPLCQYPSYPRYRGGDAKLATSFVCRAGEASK